MDEDQVIQHGSELLHRGRPCLQGSVWSTKPFTGLCDLKMDCCRRGMSTLMGRPLMARIVI